MLEANRMSVAAAAVFNFLSDNIISVKVKRQTVESAFCDEYEFSLSELSEEVFVYLSRTFQPS